MATRTKRPKVTQAMIEGKASPPKGYVLKRVPHKLFTYINTVGNLITVEGHCEHILVRTKSKASPSKGRAK